jgi:MFS family permease
MVVSAGLAAIVFPIFGKLCDSFDPRHIMPVAFIIRCFGSVLFFYLEAPNTMAALCVCSLLVIASVGETITIDTIFYKRLAKETRGVLCGAYSWAG